MCCKQNQRPPPWHTTTCPQAQPTCLPAKHQQVIAAGRSLHDCRREVSWQRAQAVDGQLQPGGSRQAEQPAIAGGAQRAAGGACTEQQGSSRQRRSLNNSCSRSQSWALHILPTSPSFLAAQLSAPSHLLALQPPAAACRRRPAPRRGDPEVPAPRRWRGAAGSPTSPASPGAASSGTTSCR